MPEEQEELTEAAHASSGRVPKIIISGGPASGKGTQCDFIVKEWNVVHLSSGDMLRAAIESGSDEGKQAQEYMNTGKLVPDELIIDIVANRVKQRDCCERGFVLDGFPRTAVQVQALLASGVQCDVFLQIDVADEAIVERVAGRRMDPETGRIYHLKYLPPPEDVVHRLQQRADDTEEKIRVRLATYHRNLAGIIDNFEHCTVRVDTNDKKPPQIWREFRQGMKRYLLFHVIFVLGAPSSGKSVMCHEVAANCKEYVVISVSSLVAAEESSGSEHATVIKKAVATGKDIPVDLLLTLISAEMLKLFNHSSSKRSRIIIDGFPITRKSLEEWDRVMSRCATIDFFLHLHAPVDVLLPRLLPNMSVETAQEQVVAYEQSIAPLLAMLDRSGKLRTLDASMSIKVIVKDAVNLLSGVSIINPYERTLAVIKPDAVADGHAHEIHRAIVADGRLNILASKLLHFDGKASEEFYVQEFKDASMKNALKALMASGPSLCLVLEGPDAVRVWRAMMGPTDSRVAAEEAPASLRALYGSDSCRNAVHGSDSEGSAMREIDFLLSPTGSGHRLSSQQRPTDLTNPWKNDFLSTFAREEKGSSGFVLEDTCAVLKPHTCDLYYDEIIAVIRSQGFEIISELKTQLTEKRTRQFYEEHKDKDFFEALVAYMCTRRVVCLQLRRVGAVATWRSLMGPADLKHARRHHPESLRTLFATDLTKNAVGGSDSLESARREIAHYFSLRTVPEDSLPAPETEKKPLPPIAAPPLPPPPVANKKHKSPYELEPVSRGDMRDMNSYNKSKIHPVLGPVISKLIMSRPENVREFILHELQPPSDSGSQE